MPEVDENWIRRTIGRFLVELGNTYSYRHHNDVRLISATPAAGHADQLLHRLDSADVPALRATVDMSITDCSYLVYERGRTG